MSKVEIKKLKAQLAAAKKAKAAELKDMVELINTKKELDKLQSPWYDQRELQRQDNLKLDALIETIKEQYAADDRKMSFVFGYGVIPSKMLAILKSIQFSKTEEKHELLLMTGLDESILEDTLDAFGNTAYFSKASVEIVPEQPMDIDKVKELLEMVATDMGLVSNLDLSRFNTDNVKYQYDRARLKAEEMYDNTKAYIEEATEYEE